MCATQCKPSSNVGAEPVTMTKTPNLAFDDAYDIRLPVITTSWSKHFMESPDAPYWILGPQSTQQWQHAAEFIARLFKREEHYDFVQFRANEWSCDRLNKDRVLLFTNSGSYYRHDLRTLIGAVCMRWRDEKYYTEPTPAHWAISFVWFHPWERRRGHLTKAWPFMQAQFPGFYIETPYSPEMHAFLKKQGWTHPFFKKGDFVQEEPK